MPDKTHSVLFLSRRGSARGLMAEAILNRIGQGRFEAHSAAVDPADEIDPTALELLRQLGYPTDGLKPKHFRAFASASAQPLGFVFTLSDTAAGEALPEWPGLPVSAHWSSPDVVRSGTTGEVRRRAFARAHAELERRLKIFVSLPIAALDRRSLQVEVAAIGRKPVAEGTAS